MVCPIKDNSQRDLNIGTLIGGEELADTVLQKRPKIFSWRTYANFFHYSLARANFKRLSSTTESNKKREEN